MNLYIDLSQYGVQHQGPVGSSGSVADSNSGSSQGIIQRKRKLEQLQQYQITSSTSSANNSSSATFQQQPASGTTTAIAAATGHNSSIDNSPNVIQNSNQNFVRAPTIKFFDSSSSYQQQQRCGQKVVL